MKRIGVICGGSGSSKFATAISDYAALQETLDVGFIANVADNYWYHGLYVCPDVDIITYALSENLDLSKGWGVRSDTFRTREAISKLSASPEWFSLGDLDSALCLVRTELMQKGWTLSSVTSYFCRVLGAKYAVIPATDDRVSTFVKTVQGTMHLQEYWVKHKAKPAVVNSEFVGSSIAVPNPKALQYLASYAIVCPANPITSVLPTISLKRMKGVLAGSKVVAVSPFLGDRPFSGPAGKLMEAVGIEANSYGVARLYSRFLKILLVDVSEESRVITKIKDLGIECMRTNTRIVSKKDGSQIAMELLNSL